MVFTFGWDQEGNPIAPGSTTGGDAGPDVPAPENAQA